MHNVCSIINWRSDPALVALLGKARPCWICGSRNHNHVPQTDGRRPPLFVLSCGACGSRGMWATSIEDAIKAWG
jgi:hypothetical protein